jgi:hypothetical protein
MPFNVADFSATINRHGVALNNLFLARFSLPASLSSGDNEGMNIRDIPFFCRSVQLPDLELNVTDIKTQGHGVSQKRATAMENGTVPLVFMVDSNFAIKKLFHQWNQSVFNHGNGSGPLNSVDGRGLYEFNYHDDYSSTLEVVVYSYHQEQITYNYKFNGAFPVSVGGVQVAWENGAEVMTITVNFAYDSFSVEGADDGVVTGFNSKTGLLGFLSSINSVAQQIKQIRKPNSIQDLITQTNNVGRLIDTLPF